PDANCATPLRCADPGDLQKVIAGCSAIQMIFWSSRVRPIADRIGRLPSSFVVEGIALACSASQFPRFLQRLDQDEECVHEGPAARRNARWGGSNDRERAAMVGARHISSP